ncbi:MAG: hypothetical protein FWG91_09015 [Lachnospiraceae bacterium]|nr:hypothetical protein [Lachnospiraceae bacterium]
MCPVFDHEYKRCKVSPSDSQCYQSDGEQQSYCLTDYNYNSCANYEAYQRGDYRIYR